MRRLVVLLLALTLAALAVPAPGSAAPAAPAGTATTDPVTDLGTPLTALTVMQGVIGHDPTDGSDVVYAVPAGENAALNVVDLHSRTLKRAVPLPGASGSWAITVAPDGSVYVGSYGNGHLYRYDPTTGTAADLGQPVAGEQYLYSLTAGPDGTVYGGTYPHTHAFAYHPGGTVTDYGSLDTVGQYVRSAVFDPDLGALFVGLATPAARLFRIDVATGTHTELTPAGFTGSGLSDLDYAAGKVFGNVDGSLVVFDAATGKQVSYTDPTGATVTRYPLAARGVSPPSGGSVYFTSTGSALTRYDLATGTVVPVLSSGKPVVVTRGAAIGYGWVTENGAPVLYGLAGNYSGGTFRYDPAAGTLTQWSSPFRYVPVPLMNALVDPADGSVLVNAFLNGTTGVYHPGTGATTATTRLGQVEGWTWADGSAGDAGKLYFGIYPYGQVSVWDPTRPATATNPRVLFTLVDSDQQNRPVAVTESGGVLYAGTTPGYGVWGGALTAYDLTTGTLAVHRNIVPDQTVDALLPVGDQLWAGSSVDGGQGTDPKATEAVLFRYDKATGTAAATYTPVPGAHSVNELTAAPDGTLWGLADGTAFHFDPASGRVLRRVPVFTGATGAQDGALVWRDGYLHGVDGGRLFTVDTLAGTATVLRGSGLLRLAAAPDGTLYTLLRPDGATDPTHLASYTPPVDGCPGSDLRARVWLGTVDSRVANRFARDGCTVADLLPARTGWPSHGAYVAAVARVTGDLVSAGTLSRVEAAAIIGAAARS